LGETVIVGGLSGGGTLAAWLALERPQAINRTILFAAYLSSSSRVLDLFVKKIDTYFEWAVNNNNPSKGSGYNGFPVSALRVFLHLGQDILKRSEKQPAAPLFIVASDSDIATGSFDHKTLFENALSRQPITWYNTFSRELAVPHTMMTVQEGNRWASLLPVMTKAFVESNLTWAEVQEIGYRMTQGKTFPSVVAELGLVAKASPDMPAMMTMVDKRAIVQTRNPSSFDINA
jgi:carboxylesterase